MARQTQLDSARLRRDLGLARARRLTVYAGVGATAFTAVISLVAATSLPGRAASTALGAQSNPSGGITQPGLNSPAQPPQYVYGGVPVVVSGSS